MPTGGTLILDSEGLSKAVLDDRGVMARIRVAQEEDKRVVVSNMTLIEVHHGRISTARFNWVVSRLRTEPVTDEIAREAMRLLKAANLHGHQHAIDAVVAATALKAVPPAVILTSDPEDMTALRGDRASVIKV